MPLIIVLVGFNGSGKTTLAKKLEKDLSINIVSGDPVRKMIKDEVLYFKDLDLSIPTDKGKLTRPIVQHYREQMCRLLLLQGLSVIHDSAGLTAEYRKNAFENSCRGVGDVTKVILWLKTTDEELLKRLGDRSEEHWVQHHQNINQPKFIPPTDGESDVLLTYTQDNYEYVKTRLAELINSY